MKKTNPTCKTCRLLVVPLDKAGRRVVRKDRMYCCAAPLPEVNLPLNITKHFSFNWPPRRTMVEGTWENCPCWEERS